MRDWPFKVQQSDGSVWVAAPGEAVTPEPAVVEEAPQSAESQSPTQRTKLRLTPEAVDQAGEHPTPPATA